MGDLLSRFCSVFVCGDRSFVMGLRYTNGQTQVESITRLTVPLGFCRGPLAGWYPVSFSY